MDVIADFLPQGKRGVIIHHWDTDGLCSAAELLNYCQKRWPDKKIDTFVPTITNYYLTEQQYTYLQKQGYDFVMTCDINFQADTINRLAELFPKQAFIFDHHHQTPYTNVHYYNEPYPSCAAYICAALQQPYSLTAVMAIVGDREESIQKDPKFYPIVQEGMAEHGLTFSQLLDVRRLIDSNYIVEDYAGMITTIELLRHDPLAVLTDVTLQSNVQRMGNEIDILTTVTPKQVTDLIMEFTINTHMNLLSQMTRHWSRQYPDNIIITHQFQHEQYNCYMRRRTASVDMRSMISYARSLGLNAGGKEEVVGIIIPDGKFDYFFPKLVDQLKQLVNA